MKNEILYINSIEDIKIIDMMRVVSKEKDSEIINNTPAPFPLDPQPYSPADEIV